LIKYKEKTHKSHITENVNSQNPRAVIPVVLHRRGLGTLCKPKKNA